MPDNKVKGVADQAKGRVKQAAGDLLGDEDLQRTGAKEEERGKAREELEEAHEEVEQRTRRVSRLEE